MKKIVFAILTAAIVISTASCGAGTAPRHVTKEIKGKDNKILMNIDFAYPQIEGNLELSEIFRKNAEADAQRAVEDFQWLTTEQDAVAEDAQLPFEDTRTYEITYESPSLLSIVWQEVSYAGGAHPNTIQTSSVYDLTENRLLTLAELLGCTKEEAYSAAVEEFEKLAEKEPEMFFTDAIENLSDIIQAAGYYLTENGVTVYFNPYDIAPGAGGIQSIELTAEQFPDFLKNVAAD